MKLAIMQPYIFPYLGYFQLINLVDTFVFYDDVNFIKKGWINRNQILNNTGTAQMFTVPLLNASQNKLIMEVELMNDKKWLSKFLKGLEQTYKKAPYFDNGFGLVKEVLETELSTISELSQLSIMKVSEYLNFETQFKKSSDSYSNQGLKAQHRILDICKTENANHYINPIGGIEIYDRDLFKKEEIVLNFIESQKVTYKQFDNEFVPYLSIIDCLMFLDKEEIKQHLGVFKLV